MWSRHPEQHCEKSRETRARGVMNIHEIIQKKTRSKEQAAINEKQVMSSSLKRARETLTMGTYGKQSRASRREECGAVWPVTVEYLFEIQMIVGKKNVSRCIYLFVERICVLVVLLLLCKKAFNVIS